MPTHEELRKAQMELHRLTYEHWIQYDLFSLNWWLLLAVMIIPWIIWWKLVNKDHLIEITLFGLFTALASAILNTIGFSIGLWSYPAKLIPINPPLFPADFTLLPVTYMLIYQYFKYWDRFFIACITVFAIFAFVGEPFLESTNIYTKYHWEYIYSFPIYVAMPMFFRWLVKKMKLAISEEDNKSLRKKLNEALQDQEKLLEKIHKIQSQQEEKRPWWKRIFKLS